MSQSDRQLMSRGGSSAICTVPQGLRPQLSLVCFVFNEIGTLETVIREYKQWFIARGLTHEIIIIDDGSTDGSSGLADKLAAEYTDIRVIHHPSNLGLGYGFIEGYKQFNGEWLSFTSTDRQFPCTVLDTLIPPMADHDLVLGYVRPQHRSLLAMALSQCERTLIRLCFGRLPRFQGNFLVSRHVIQAMKLVSRGRGWMIQMEMIIRAMQAGVRITSVLTEIRPREYSVSRATSFKAVLSNLQQVISLFLIFRCEGRRK